MAMIGLYANHLGKVLNNIIEYIIRYILLLFTNKLIVLATKNPEIKTPTKPPQTNK